MDKIFLIDSNILIYGLTGHKKILNKIENGEFNPCAISVISKLEVLLGATKKKQPLEEIQPWIEKYAAFPIDNQVTNKAFKMRQEDGINLKFKDLLIAATAKEYECILVTADKDFKKLKEVEVELIKL